mmetsp:Transcript_4383/g.6718  ORF Transcript_4383/g.6718 Transcript_4383/m.6718 type:complete len:153 (+) Transcript_4383:396-854(+)
MVPNIAAIVLLEDPTIVDDDLSPSCFIIPLFFTETISPSLKVAKSSSQLRLFDGKYELLALAAAGVFRKSDRLRADTAAVNANDLSLCLAAACIPRYLVNDSTDLMLMLAPIEKNSNRVAIFRLPLAMKLLFYLNNLDIIALYELVVVARGN